MNALLRLLHRDRPTPHPAAAPAVDPAADAPPAGDVPRGCGWFDSSHELQAGLAVTEHASPDAVANELPLDAWIALHLAGAATPRPTASCGE